MVLLMALRARKHAGPYAWWVVGMWEQMQMQTHSPGTAGVRALHQAHEGGHQGSMSNVPLSKGQCGQVITENQVWCPGCPDPMFSPPQLGATSERRERKNPDLTKTKVLPKAEWGIKGEIAFSFFFPIWLCGLWNLFCYTAMRHLMIGLCSEKCLIKPFRHCTNIMECT